MKTGRGVKLTDNKQNNNNMNTVYFQPPDINKQYCEVGTISEKDPEYIWYLDEPCKILISEVKIIEKENVIFDKKSRLLKVRQNEL